MKRWSMLLVAAVAGDIALSYEILWIRAYSFVTGGTASSFGVLLSAYLLGLALGSLASWAYCTERTALAGATQLRAPASLLLAGSLLGFLSIPVLAELVRSGRFHALWLLLVALIAGLIGAVMPLISHLGIPPDERAGVWLSHLYVANIIGSTAGSLVTGFLLLDVLSIRGVSTLLALLGLALAATLAAASRPSRAGLLAWIGVVAFSAAVPVFAGERIFHHVFEKLQHKERYDPAEPFSAIVENRSGVITVQRDGVVYGGGVYDGAYNTDLVHDKNLVVRAYALAAIHPQPRRVLLIGLSTGSWAQILVHNPDVERLTVVEINPGYLSLLRQHPEVESLPASPKLEVVIDDGRRWLTAHPERLFDAIISNTTWHWRSMATSLLSTEFLELLRRHLSVGGVILYNTTFSLEAQKTGCMVFPHGFRMLNSMVVSDSPVAIDRERWRAALLAYRIDGKPVLQETNPEHMRRLEEVLRIGPTPGRPEARNRDYQPCPNVLWWTRDLRTVTDDNMATEWYRPWWATP